MLGACGRFSAYRTSLANALDHHGAIDVRNRWFTVGWAARAAYRAGTGPSNWWIHTISSQRPSGMRDLSATRRIVVVRVQLFRCGFFFLCISGAALGSAGAGAGLSRRRNSTVDFNSGVFLDWPQAAFLAMAGRSWPVNRSTNDLPHIEHLTSRPRYSAGASNCAWQCKHSTMGIWRSRSCLQSTGERMQQTIGLRLVRRRHRCPTAIFLACQFPAGCRPAVYLFASSHACG